MEIHQRLERRRQVAASGCWLWTGYVTPFGYGDIRVAGKTKRVHRVAYEVFVGAIPAGHEIDHECHNVDPICPGGVACLHRRCFNPAHLAPRSHRDNDLRGKAPNIITHRTDVCQRGHVLSQDNTIWRTHQGRTWRQCRACWEVAAERGRIAYRRRNP